MRRRSLVLAAILAAWSASAAAQEDPRDPSARRHRAAQLRAFGAALVASGDPGSAYAYFRDAITVDPSDADAYCAIARIHIERREFDRAAEVLSIGLRRRRDNADLWLLLAAVLRETRGAAEAAEALRAAVDLAPTDATILRAQLTLARERGAWAEALAAARRLVAIAEGDAPRRAASLEARALAILARAIDPVADPWICADDRGRSIIRAELARCPTSASAPTPRTRHRTEQR